MTEGSKYPEGVEVHQRDLVRTETTKANAIKQRMVDTGQVRVEGGPVTPDFSAYRGGRNPDGLEVTVNAADNTLVDISAGSGYAPNGERIEVDTSQLGVSLSDYTDGANNLVCLVYIEVPQTLRPHETDGTSRNTECVSSYRVEVFTQTAYDALPDTFDADFDQNTKDRALIIAEVLGNGTTGGVPNALVSGEISQENDPVILMGLEWVGTGIPGVRLANVQHATDPSLNEGVGTLELTVVSDTVKNLTYAAPGEAAGAGVNIAGSAGPHLAFSSGPTNFVMVRSLVDSLPVSGVTSENVTVSRLYEPAGQLVSASDARHRRLAGGDSFTAKSTALNEENPHGVDLDAIGPTQSFAGQLELVRGSTTDPAVASRPTVTAQVADDPGVARTCVFKMRPDSGVGPAIRFFQGNTTSDFAFEITYNADWRPDLGMWRKDQAGNDAYRMVYGNTGTTPLFLEVRQADADFVAFDFQHAIFNRGGPASTAGLLNLSALNLTADNQATVPRLEIDGTLPASGNQRRTLVLQSGQFAATNSNEFRVWRVNTDDPGPPVATGTGKFSPLEITWNATFNNAAATWSLDNAAESGLKLEIDDNGIAIHRKAPTGASWADNAWDGGTTSLNTDTGDLTVAGNIGFRTTTYVHSIPAAAFFAAEADMVNGGGVFDRSIQALDPVPSGNTTASRSSASATASCIWPLHLPDGAVVTSASWRGSQTVTVGESRWGIYRKQHTGGQAVSGLYSSSYTAFNATIGSITDNAINIDQNQTIDNATYNYFVWLGDSGTDQVAMTIINIRISYTLNVVSGV